MKIIDRRDKSASLQSSILRRDAIAPGALTEPYWIWWAMPTLQILIDYDQIPDFAEVVGDLAFLVCGFLSEG